MRDALALAHDARAIVGDVQVVGQDKGAAHAALFLVVVDLLESRAAVANIEQQLVELRCVLFHHRGDLVVHEVLDTLRLHGALTGFFAHDHGAHRTAGG